MCSIGNAKSSWSQGPAWSLWTIASALLLLCSGCAAPPVASSPPLFQETDAVAELKKSAAGWNAGDLDAFMAIYAENATFAQADSFLRGRAAIRALYAPAFAPGLARDSLGFDRVELDRISNDALLVRAIYHTSRQGVVVRRGATTLLMRPFNGQWRIVHDQSN